MTDPCLIPKPDLDFLVATSVEGTPELHSASPAGTVTSRRIYLASQTGRLSTADIYSKITNLKFLLYIVVTNAGTILGGYHSIPLNKPRDTFNADDSAFIYGLVAKNSPKRVVCRAVPGKRHIHDWASLGPAFGHHGWHLFLGKEGVLGKDNGAWININGGDFQEPPGGPLSLNNGEAALGPIIDLEIRQLFVVHQTTATPTPPILTASSRLQLDDVENLRRQLAEALKESSNKDTTIATLSSTLKSRDGDIAQLNTTIARLQQQHNDDSQRLLLSQNETANLKRQLHDLRQQQTQSQLATIASNVKNATYDDMLFLCQYLGRDLSAVEPNKLTASHILSFSSFQEYFADTDADPPLLFPLLHVFSVVHYCDAHQALPRGRRVSEWLLQEKKQSVEVAGRFDEFDVKEEMMSHIPVDVVCHVLGLKLSLLKAIVTDFQVAHQDTVTHLLPFDK